MDQDIKIELKLTQIIKKGNLVKVLKQFFEFSQIS